MRRGAFAAAGLALLLAGCAATRPVAVPGADLDAARSTFRTAAADPEVQLRAPVELALAERSLAAAEDLWRRGAASDLIAHQTYLAEQRARIALKSAEYRKAEATLATSGEQRNRILLEARAREAEIAEEHARLSEAARIEAEQRAQALGAEVERKEAADLGAELARLQAQVSELKARRTERGWVLTLRNELLFDAGSATLKAGASRAVDKLAEFLRKAPERDVAVEGFTDTAGGDEANRRLSEQRAEAMKRALVARGVEPSRIDTRGYGPAFPVASNDTPGGRQLNRRVEIVINPS